MKNIELEIRAVVEKRDYAKMLSLLKKRGIFDSKTKRISVMFFGKIEKDEIDVRVRITNKKAEVVLKRGDFHSHDRKEVSFPIKKEQFLDQVKIFQQIFSDIKVGERETFNFNFPNGVVVSLVRAGNISYVELEKMSSKKDAKKNSQILRSLADDLSLKIIESSEEYVALCNKLTKKVDWRFSGTRSDHEKLEDILKEY